MASSKEFLPQLLKRIDSYFQLAAIKASLILPADIILLLSLLEFSDKLQEKQSDNWLLWLILILGLLAISISLLFAAKATTAFLKGKASSDDYESILFFGSIAQMELHGFEEKSGELRLQDLPGDFAKQIHLLSGNLIHKFRCVNTSITFLVIGSILTIVFKILTIT